MLVATVLTVLAALAWRRSRRGRIGLLTLGFGLVAAAGAITAYGLFSGMDAVDLLAYQSALVAAGLLTVYFAAVKR